MIHQKCQILCVALHLALEHMNQWSWQQYCKGAVIAAKRMGIALTNHPETVATWYRGFHKARKFSILLKAKHNLPPFLELNPDVLSAIK